MPLIVARLAAFVAVTLSVVVELTGCSSPNRSSAHTTTATTTCAYQYRPPTSASPTSSGDPLYDRYAAALTAAGIHFTPGTAVWEDYGSDKRLCDDIRNGETDAFDLATRQKVATQAENGRRIAIMIPILCPDQQAVLDEALGPSPKMRTFLSGKYFVGYGLDSNGAPLIQPGTYKTGTVSDCYWERLDSQGNIIDNNFVSMSKSVMVTIAASDAAFNARGCGRWKRAD